MVGRRLPDGDHPVEPGDYSFVDGSWWIKVPINPTSAGCLDNHEVVEHEDGTITVSPSILLDETPGFRPGWHGYLERGIWRSC